MELDTLKYIFLEHNSKAAIETTPADIGRSLKKKSASQVAFLKRNLLAELIVAVLFTAFPVYILFSHNGNYISILAGVFLLVVLLFIIRIIKLLSAIRRYQSASLAIKQHLRLLIDIINKFCRLYIHSTIILVPLLFGAAALFVHMDNMEKDPLLFQLTSADTFILYLVVALIWSVGMYFFTTWYVKKLYGEHLKQLQQYLGETQ